MRVRRFLRDLTILIFFSVILSTKFLSHAAQVVSPVTGKVVDAITARPIQGISLTLQTSTYEGFSVNTEVKNIATSNLFGRVLTSRDEPSVYIFFGPDAVVLADSQ